MATSLIGRSPVAPAEPAADRHGEAEEAEIEPDAKTGSPADHPAPVASPGVVEGGAPAEAAPAALAPPGEAPFEAEPVSTTRRYGGWVALGDGATVMGFLGSAMMFASQSRRGSTVQGLPILIAGLGGYLFVSPAIHLYHGNPSSSWKSLGLRAGALTAGIAVIPTLGDDYWPVTIVLIFGALAVDWAGLAKVQVTAEPVAPYVAPTEHGGAAFGLVGRF
jgi:hypothetical protein